MYNHHQVQAVVRAECWLHWLWAFFWLSGWVTQRHSLGWYCVSGPFLFHWSLLCCLAITNGAAWLSHALCDRGSVWEPLDHRPKPEARCGLTPLLKRIRKQNFFVCLNSCKIIHKWKELRELLRISIQCKKMCLSSVKTGANIYLVYDLRQMLVSQYLFHHQLPRATTWGLVS